ncbi:MAG: restriction endonuclease [Candidatus Hydrogenedentales bacterium]|jgi:hypothetical protein
MSEDLKSYRYEPVALSNESTVVAEFRPEVRVARETAYQSEAQLEKDFIKQLQVQAYEYLSFTPEADLIANLRRPLEKLNKLQFSDAEWDRFFSTCIAGSGDGGIDVRGALVVGDVVRIKIAVQVKKWKRKNNIPAPVVQQARGSLGAHEQGLIITTRDISAGAIKEAAQPDKTPIGLAVRIGTTPQAAGDSHAAIEGLGVQPEQVSLSGFPWVIPPLIRQQTGQQQRPLGIIGRLAGNRISSPPVGKFPDAVGILPSDLFGV